MPQPPQLPSNFDGWVAFFAAGNRITIPVSQELVAKRLRGNRQVFVGTIIVLALSLVLVGLFIFTDFGRTLTYILVGVFIVLLVIMLNYLRRIRKRLDAAASSPQYLELDRDGFVITGGVRVPWTQSVGVLASDLRSQQFRTGIQRGGASLARRAGNNQCDLWIGLTKHTAKPLRDAADERHKFLIETIGDNGFIRLPLDAVLPQDQVNLALIATPAAAHNAGLENVNAHDSSGVHDALARIMNSQPPVTGRKTWDPEPKADEPEPTAVRVPAASPTASQPPPPPPTPPAPPTQPDNPPEPTIQDLAGFALDAEGSREFEAASAHLAAHGVESFADEYPDYDNGEDEGPSPIGLLLAVGEEKMSVGWVDAGYEDNPGHIRWRVTEACKRFGHPVPEFAPEGPDGNDAVLARLREADAALATVGLRLVFIDPDADAYYFVPVPAARLAGLDRATGPGFTLHSVDTLP